MSSFDESTAGVRSGRLRKFVPVAVIVVVALVVVGVVALVAGDDAGDATAGSGGGGPGAVSWSMAEEAGTVDEQDWLDSCDRETGLVAFPGYAECYAGVDDNGGATYHGVTEDTVTVVFYVPKPDDIVLNFILGPLDPAEVTVEQGAETVRGYADVYNALFQTYGRKIEVKVLEASGNADDEVAARADAKRAVEEMGAFAVWRSPELTTAWTDEIAALGAICLGCRGGSPEYMDDRAPYVVGLGINWQQGNLHVAEYVTTKLGGEPALHAGDPAMHERERTFAHVYVRYDPEAERAADQLGDLLAEDGVELTEQLGYEVDPFRMQEQAANIIARLKSSGVTTVLLQTDPVMPVSLTQEATAQEYFPEWVVAGGNLVDTIGYGRVYDQAQWRNAFGITTTTVPVDVGEPYTETVYEWFHSTRPPAGQATPFIAPFPALFFAGVQSAGPHLTPETFRDGLFSWEPPEETLLTFPTLTWGDHGLWPAELGVDWNGIDDMTEWWWDPDREGRSEVGVPGRGVMMYVDGGRRYLLGQWPSDLRVFDPVGAVASYDEPQESVDVEVPPPPR